MSNASVPTRAIATSTLWQFGSQLIMAALSIATVKLVAVGLSKELAGNYHSVYGYLQVFGILADFGLYAVALREVSTAQDRQEILGVFLILRSITLILSLSAALLIAWVLPVWQGTPLPIGITIAALVPFFTLLSGVLRTIFQMHYRMHYVFIAEVTQRVVTVFLLATLVFLGVRGSNDLQDYHLFLFIGGIGAFVLFLLSFAFASGFLKIRPRWNQKLFAMLLARALPFGFAFLCAALYQKLDVTLIALLRPDYELQNAYYGFVQRIVEMGYLLPTLLLNSLLPLLRERDTDGKDTRTLLGKTLFLLLILGSTMFLFALLWPRPIMRLLTTDAYLSTAMRPGSDTALHWLSFPMLLNALILYAFYVLLARHRWRPLVTILAAGALLSIALNLSLIPRFGFLGATATSVATHAFLAAMLLPVSLRTLPISFPRLMLFRWLAFTVLLAAMLYLLTPFLTTVPMIVLTLAIAGVALATITLGLGIHRTVM